MDRYIGCLKGVSKSVQVLFDGIEAVMVVTLMILTMRALSWLPSFPPRTSLAEAIAALSCHQGCKVLKYRACRGFYSGNRKYDLRRSRLFSKILLNVY